MELMIPNPQQDHMDDFDFNSARSSPCPTTPSTPRGFGSYYTSAPTTPSRLSEFYQEFHDFTITNDVNEDGKVSYYFDDFAFDAMKEDMNINEVVSAEDLFEGGIIKPMNININCTGNNNSNNNTNSNNKARFLSRRENSRGRERSSSSRKRETRSLSPLRVSESAWEELHDQQQSSSVAKPTSTSRRKCRLRDFFLFRSASEGRADEKDNLKKYSIISRSRRGNKEERKKKSHTSFKNSSFWK